MNLGTGTCPTPSSPTLSASTALTSSCRAHGTIIGPTACYDFRHGAGLSQKQHK